MAKEKPIKSDKDQMDKIKESERFMQVVNISHIFLKNTPSLFLADGKATNMVDLWLTFLKTTLASFKKADRDRVIALLEITEREFFAGINHAIWKRYDVPGLPFKIGGVYQNKAGQLRMVDSILRPGKNAEFLYRWIDLHSGISSQCNEVTFTKWLEKGGKDELQNPESNN